MWYGLSRTHFLQTLAFFVGLGVVAALLGTVARYFDEVQDRSPWSLVALLVTIPSIWIAMGTVLCTTWLRVEDDRIEWYLWKRFRLNSCHPRDVIRLEPGSFSAMRIKTSKGTMRLFGIHAQDQVSLSEHLLALNPNITQPSLDR
jgi:hypothetical protein